MTHPIIAALVLAQLLSTELVMPPHCHRASLLSTHFLSVYGFRLVACVFVCMQMFSEEELSLLSHCCVITLQACELTQRDAYRVLVLRETEGEMSERTGPLPSC